MALEREEVDVSKSPYVAIQYRPRNQKLWDSFEMLLRLVEIASQLQDFRSERDLIIHLFLLLEKCETLEDLEDVQKGFKELARVGTYGEAIFESCDRMIILRKKDIPFLPRKVSKLKEDGSGVESEYFKVKVDTNNVALALRIRMLLTSLAIADIHPNSQNVLFVSARFVNALGFCQNEEELTCIRHVLEEISKMGGYATTFYHDRVDLLTLDGLAKIKAKFGDKPDVKVNRTQTPKPIVRKKEKKETTESTQDYAVEPIPDAPPVLQEQPVVPQEEEKEPLTVEEKYDLEEFTLDYQKGMDSYDQMLNSPSKRVDLLEELFYALRKLDNRLEGMRILMDVDTFERYGRKLEEAIKRVQSLYLRTVNELEEFELRYKRCVYDFSEVLDGTNLEDLEEIQTRFHELQNEFEELKGKLPINKERKYAEELEDMLRKIAKKIEMATEQTSRLESMDHMVY